MKIVFRIVSALLALCVIPAAYYLKFLLYRIDAVVVPVGDEVSIQYLVQQFFGKNSPLNGMFSGMGGDFFANASVKRLMPAAVCFLVFFALSLILSIVIFFFSVFSNKRLVITCLGGGGLLSVIAAKISFGRLAAPLLSGEIKISNFINTDKLGSMLGIIMNFGVSMIKVTILKLTSAPVIMMFIYAAIIIWGLANIVTDDNIRVKPVKVKKVKKNKREDTNTDPSLKHI